MIVVASGPLAVEKAVLDRVDALLAGADADIQLRYPIRIIVPSQSLRLHLAAALVRRRGRGIAGVVVQTLFAAALEVLNRAGTSMALDDSLFAVIVPQLAACEPPLRDALGHLMDGYAAVTATVSDLLDAGFTEMHAEPLLELLTAAAPDAAAGARAQALVHVATQALAAMERYGVTRAATLLQHARDAFAADPPRLLPARALLVHGFADVTAVAADFLEELIRRHDGTMYLDYVTDPADPIRTDTSVAFTDRLRARFGAAAPTHADADPTNRPPSEHANITLLQAPGAEAEVRAVANRIRALLDAGVVAEGIGIVLREPAPYVIALRTHLARLGIPFSALGVRGPIDGSGRRLGAVLDLLKHGERAPVERWLDAAVRLGEIELTVMQRADLRVGLRAHGAARVGDAAALDPDTTLSGRAALLLPVRRGLYADEDNPERAPSAERRKLQPQVWRNAIAAAARLLRLWRQWPPQASLGEHVACTTAHVAGELGWQPDSEPLTTLTRLLQSLPHDFMLERDEFLALLERVTGEVGASVLGGAGAGVQILSVVEARARTWQHLFVLGVNRDVFPRVVREDPLLPDPLRRALTAVLPDLPIKEIGYDEERYLFAQLLAASRKVTLSWQFIDDDGKPRAASSLVERLTAARPELGVETVASLYAPDGAESLRPAHEHAVLAGLYANRSVFAQVLPLALAAVEGVENVALARTRIAVLNEIDPDLRSADGRARRRRLGPYFGFIGALRAPADLRRQRLYVTTIERVARCPWQTFLLRLLGLEQAPDPLASLPDISPLMVGSTVHQVLEEIAAAPAGDTPCDLAAVAQRHALAVAWPPPAKVESMLRAAAARVLSAEGLGLPGFERVLVEWARPYLEAAHLYEWGSTPPAVLATEAEGYVRLGPDSEVWFRADRVDRSGEALRLTDYKTGKPFPDAKTEPTRQRKLVDKVRSGEALQAAAYALAARAFAAGGAGRYAFLRPDIDDYAREAVVASDNEEVTQAFATTVATVLDAWRTGSFFPRLVAADQDKEPPACEFCDVSAACLRGDSTSRRRLREWGEDAKSQPSDDAERTLLALWQLGSKEAEKPDEE